MNNPTIAIVDDEEELRENLRDLLEYMGYTVIAFENGESFLEQIDTLSVDLLLLDIQLPGIDGLEVLQQLRPKYPELPVIVISASSVRGILAKAGDYGANQVILKPYSLEEVMSSIRTLLKSTH